MTTGMGRSLQVCIHNTTGEDLVQLYTNCILGKDMALALGSTGVTIVAMVLHTQ